MLTQLTVIGDTPSILRAMFPQNDAHIVAWKRWKYLVERWGDSSQLRRSWQKLQEWRVV